MGLCIKVEKIRVRSLAVTHHEVSWEVASTAEDIFDYTFQVLRSEAAAGPWTPLSPEMRDQYFFIDNRIKTGNESRQHHYIIRVKCRQSGETKDFGPASMGGEPDLQAIEIRKHINLLMREFVGRRCWVLPVRTFGQRCPDCFNSTLKARTKSGCRLCYDTSFVRGYMSPIESFIQFDPNPKNNQQTNMGELQQSNTTARMGFFPPLKPKDVIIEPENRRWRVVTVSSTQRLRAVIHQEIQMHEIPKTDSEYLIDIDLGSGTVQVGGCEEVTALNLNDMFLAGARNYTNPQNLTNFEDEEIPAIFSLYPTTYPGVKT